VVRCEELGGRGSCVDGSADCVRVWGPRSCLALPYCLRERRRAVFARAAHDIGGKRLERGGAVGGEGKGSEVRGRGGGGEWEGLVVICVCVCPVGLSRVDLLILI
jgi:hypothetical protein